MLNKCSLSNFSCTNNWLNTKTKITWTLFAQKEVDDLFYFQLANKSALFHKHIRDVWMAKHRRVVF